MVSNIQAFPISEVMNEKCLSVFLMRVNFDIVKMENLWSAVGCKSSCSGDTGNAMFRVPKNETQLKSHWFKFLNRKNLSENCKYIFICETHYEEKFLYRDNKKRVRLRMTLDPFPTIHSQSVFKETPSMLPSSETPHMS